MAPAVFAFTHATAWGPHSTLNLDWRHLETSTFDFEKALAPTSLHRYSHPTVEQLLDLKGSGKQLCVNMIHKCKQNWITITITVRGCESMS